MFADVPWWVWGAVVLIALCLLLRAANKGFRRGVRAELIAYLKEKYPAWEVVAEHEDHLELRRDKLDEQMYLHKIYSALAAAKDNSLKEHHKIFQHFLDAIQEHRDLSNRALNLAQDGNQIMPRLVQPDFLTSVARQIKDELPHTPVPATGLCVCYVLDGAESVMYLTKKHLGELGLELAALHARALDNLEKRFPCDIVRQTAKSKAIHVIKTLDSYDAARLLLVPKYLNEGEAIAAAIPDRDTLLLSPVPEDDNWTNLSKMARNAAGDVLLNRPLKVSNGGYELI